MLCSNAGPVYCIIEGGHEGMCIYVIFKGGGIRDVVLITVIFTSPSPSPPILSPVVRADFGRQAFLLTCGASKICYTRLKEGNGQLFACHLCP
jgi:hypothetical protein